MTRRIPVAAIALSLMMAACNSGSGPETLDLIVAETTITTTTSAAPTTTTTPPALQLSSIDELLGLGDSRYPSLGNGGYDVGHYTIDLTFDPGPNTISALVLVDATATQALDNFSLDFIGFEVTGVTVDGEPAGFDRRAGELIVVPPSVLDEGQPFQVGVTYDGSPDPIQSAAIPVDVGWLTDRNGIAYVIGEPDGGRSWLPLNDHPSDKATYTFRITVPEPLVAAANGTLVERITDLGWATWVWESTQPMASYLATVVIGDLEIVDDTDSTTVSGIPVRNVLPGDLGASSMAVLATQGEMISFFADIFGPYPFEAYGIAVVDDFDGALENQTLSIFGRDLVDLPQLFETVLVHELAHQWFGDSVTPGDWGDIWLNEGFATYAEWLWVENTKGPAALQATVQGARNQMALSSSLRPPGNPPADDLFNASVYIRGGLVLHALRTEIGDDAFFATLLDYAARYRYNVVSTDDFVSIAESSSGQDLDDLFDLWLYGDGVPELP